MTDTVAPEVYFYQLDRQPLERVLPVLLERTLARGWRALVKAGSEERVAALDLALWTYTEDSFLPHGTSRSGHVAEQPVFLTSSDDCPNGAGVRFVVDGARADNFKNFIRTVFVFDGRDEEALSISREHWKAAKAAACAVTYWQQDQDGRWVRKA